MQKHGGNSTQKLCFYLPHKENMEDSLYIDKKETLLFIHEER